jgi:hypothetical protein
MLPPTITASLDLATKVLSLVIAALTLLTLMKKGGTPRGFFKKAKISVPPFKKIKNKCTPLSTFDSRYTIAGGPLKRFWLEWGCSHVTDLV